jgi:hypothetical protein
MVSTSTKSLATARTSGDARAKSPEFRQVEEDILILNALGLYYANLFRAALSYSIYEQTGDSTAAALSLASSRKGRDVWAKMAERADKIYSTDISYGDIPVRRGHWADRLPGIDHDLAEMEKYFSDKPTRPSTGGKAIQQVNKVSRRPVLEVKHTVPETFRSGDDLRLTMATPAIVTESVLWYRHVNHAERWVSAPMQKTGNLHNAFIPGSYTSSPYPLQYYFELRMTDAATLHPPFNPTFSNQPYYVVLSGK